ncbi:MAG TPA: hypothetical protein VNS22_27550 [Geminicoccus sp.]|uniref:hypothetical protein n=1 Tax=Geminicoccus sp. TaxID=2024832 RepID=UPI002BDBF457|nr:hypothetical protein [Geminicoccus sp.]HWL72115.1 hypothetical protein [Geminicoccus sp.]
MEQETRALLLRCLRQLDWVSGEGLQGVGLEDPADVFFAVAEHLGMGEDEISAFILETGEMQDEKCLTAQSQ